MKKLQTTQNKALRAAVRANTRHDRTRNETIHRNLEIEPLNIRLHHLAYKEWCKLEEIQNTLTTNSLNCNNEREYRDHAWWPRLGQIISRNEPEPLY